MQQRRTKKLLSVLLSFAMVASSVPTTALAEGLEELQGGSTQSVVEPEGGTPGAKGTESDAQQQTGGTANVVTSNAQEQPAAPAEQTPVEQTPAPAEQAPAAPAENPKPEPAKPAFEQSQTVGDVEVSVKAPEGVFPEGATLSVEELATAEQLEEAEKAQLQAAERGEDDPAELARIQVAKEDRQEVDKALEKARPEGEHVVSSRSFGIKVLDADGNELQMGDGQLAVVSFKTAEGANDNLDAAIYHMEEKAEDASAEQSKYEAEALVVTDDPADEQVVTVETNTFSYYTIEFSYSELRHTLQGDEPVKLADVLATVGLTGEVQAVSVSNQEFISVSNESGEWVVTVLQPFTTEEWLKATIDGVEYQIDVTSDQGLTAQASMTYVDAQGKTHSISNYKVYDGTYNEIKGSTTPWLVVQGNVSTSKMNRRLSVQGEVNLLLCDGASLYCNRGISVEKGAHLKVWAQSGGTGKLTAERSSDNWAAIGVRDGCELTINGGVVEAKTEINDAAGIGGSDKDGHRDAGTITINGGTVTAFSSMNAAGIGGATGGNGGTITINGGTVLATAKDEDGAGIGGGENGASGTITINGGDVTAYGPESGSGIGSGWRGQLNTITITGGKVTAFGGKHSAGIGSADDSPNGGKIAISGGCVIARGGGRARLKDSYHPQDNSVKQLSYKGENGAGIGGGNGSGGITIDITGGTVVGLGGDHAAGIGGGYKGSAGTINISGGVPSGALASEHVVSSETKAGGKGLYYGFYYEREYDYEMLEQPGNTYVAAYGSFRGAGIGSGEEAGANCGTINIMGGLVDAHGSTYSAGIGGGDESAPTAISIGDGEHRVTVNATSYNYGAAIGSGDNSDHAYANGTIVIKGNGSQTDNTTTVTATAKEDGAGIGGGDYSDGGTIVIDGAVVTAMGARRGTGIGGGANHAFKSIEIINGSRVSAAGGYGAGIGTGAASLFNDDPTHVIGGDITITDSAVTASSSNGGAGIGGGIYGRANSITISGGSVNAQGGMFLGLSEISAGFISMFILDLPYFVSKDWGSDYDSLISLPLHLVNLAIGKFVGLFTNTSNPSIIWYTGAGIGGGYREGSGRIAIENNAVVQATAGMLPPEESLRKLFDLSGAGEFLKYKDPTKESRSFAIGNGAGYTRDADVSVYDPSCVMTSMIDIVFADGRSASDIKAIDLAALKSNFTIKKTPYPPRLANGSDGATDVTENNYASITPGHMKLFVSTEKGTTGEMSPQLFKPGKTQKLTANAFQCEGKGFEGWATSPNGSVVYADGQELTYTEGGGEVLFARWASEPSFRTHALLLDGSIGVTFYMSLPQLAGIDYTQSYMEFTVSGKDGTTTTDVYDPNDLNDAGTYHAFTCYVNAIQMADTITATFHYGDGQTVSQTYSVAEYVKAFDEKLAQDPEAFDEKMVTLVHALADYGHYAQPYLANYHGWTIGTDHVEMPGHSTFTQETLDAARDESAEYTLSSRSSGSRNGIISADMSLDLLSSTTMRLDIRTLGSKLNRVTLSSGEELPFKMLDGGKYRVELSGVMAHELTNVYRVTCNSVNKTLTANISVVGFAHSILTGEYSSEYEGAKECAAAIWYYSKAANAYRAANPEA